MRRCGCSADCTSSCSRATRRGTTRSSSTRSSCASFVREQSRADERGAALVGAAAVLPPRRAAARRRRAGRRRARAERRAEPRLGRLPLLVRRRASGGRPDAALRVDGRGALAGSGARCSRSTPRVSRRVGIDLAPIDVTTDEGARLLRVLRVGGSGRAVRPARRARSTSCARIRRSSCAATLRASCRTCLRDRPTLVFQTAAFPYVSRRDARRRAGDALARRGAGRLRHGRQAARRRAGWGMRIARYPGGEREFVGHADFHGAWLDYTL